jgi:hypothetical protein
LGGLFLPLCEIYDGSLVDSIQRIQQAHQEAAVKQLASNVLGKWRAEVRFLSLCAPMSPNQML